jgi:hypothetical protein
MRFLHEDFGLLKAYLLAEPNDIRRLEWHLKPTVRSAMGVFAMTPKRRSADRPRSSSVDEIEAMVQRTKNPQLAGAVLSEYFHVNAPLSDRAVSMAAAIEHVEAYGAPNEFLIVGHPNGGFVSVSRHALPFQEAAREATSWALETRWP